MQHDPYLVISPENMVGSLSLLVQTLINCKQIANVSILNVRHVRHRKQQLANNFIKHGLDLLGIQEHDETIRYGSCHPLTWLTTSK